MYSADPPTIAMRPMDPLYSLVLLLIKPLFKLKDVMTADNDDACSASKRGRGGTIYLLNEFISFQRIPCTLKSNFMLLNICFGFGFGVWLSAKSNLGTYKDIKMAYPI